VIVLCNRTSDLYSHLEFEFIVKDDVIFMRYCCIGKRARVSSITLLWSRMRQKWIWTRTSTRRFQKKKVTSINRTFAARLLWDIKTIVLT